MQHQEGRTYLGTASLIVLAVDRVSSRNDTTTCVKAGMYTGLGDGYRLLLHHLRYKQSPSLTHASCIFKETSRTSFIGTTISEIELSSWQNPTAKQSLPLRYHWRRQGHIRDWNLWRGLKLCSKYISLVSPMLRQRNIVAQAY